MNDRNFTQRFDVFMTSLSSDNKITKIGRSYIFRGGGILKNLFAKAKKAQLNFLQA